MKRRVKHALGILAYRSGIYRRFFRDKAVVVLFHRVDDRLDGDPISCTGRQFREFCAFFREYFLVVSLGELISRLRNGRSVGGRLVITFDDGYRDNAEVAALQLEAMDLPACFFIASDFIGSQRVPWWDEDLPVTTPWMNWDQVCSLHERGFEIGSHTANHVDLGVVRGERALEEIRASRRRIEEKITARVDHFSYPYGRRDQINEENRRKVRETGYASCASAYGGAVSSRSDPHRLPRIPVSPWYISPYHFGYEAMLAST